MWLEKSRHILSTYVEQRSFALGWGSARTMIEKYLVPLDGGKNHTQQWKQDRLLSHSPQQPAAGCNYKQLEQASWDSTEQAGKKQELRPGLRKGEVSAEDWGLSKARKNWIDPDRAGPTLWKPRRTPVLRPPEFLELRCGSKVIDTWPWNPEALTLHHMKISLSRGNKSSRGSEKSPGRRARLRDGAALLDLDVIFS